MAFGTRLMPNTRRRMRVAQFTRTVVAVVALVVASTPALAQTAASPMSAPLGDALLRQAASLDVGERLRAVSALQALATPAAWNLLVIMLERDVGARVRRSAALALGAAHDPALV